MADSIVAIADLVADALDLSGTEINDILNAAPLVARMPWVPSSNGTSHKYIRHTSDPTVAFRAENAGRELSKSGDTVETANLKILDWSFRVDKAVADAWRDGGAPAFLAREARRHIRSALSKLENQILYGTDGTNGFVGFLTSTKLDALADAMVISAGGTTASTASSVYLVKLGADVGVAGVYKGDGPPPFEIPEFSVIDVAATNSHYPAYFSPACSWFGLQLGGAYSVSRICNITADNGKGLTDDLIAQAISLHPVDQQPDVIVMNRRSLRQLQDSRTATNSTGAPAPFPTEAFGYPILVTDQLSTTEALET